MQKNLSLQGWLAHLRCLLPISGVVHIGAGSCSIAARYAEWDVSTAVFIEAEEGLSGRLAPAVKGRSGWSVLTALVTDRQGESDFYVASNPNENGVIPPERLTGLWRNLKSQEKRRLNTTTLEVLLSKSNYPSECLNWAAIDCLPAMSILQGAGKYLDEWDVIIARVVVDDTHLAGIGAAKSEVDLLLSSHGFRCIAFEEERQPAIGSALYVRDWKSSLRLRLAATEQQALRQAMESAGSLTLLQNAHDEQTRRAADWQRQMEQINSARDEQTAFVNELQLEMRQLTNAHDEKTNLVVELQAQVAHMTQVRDEQTVLAAERQQQVTELIRARDEQAMMLADIRTQLDRANKLCHERAEHVTQLEAQLAEMELRQHYLNQEMVKAEAQIELIKDVLLRESEV